MDTNRDIKWFIRDVPDFPKPGIIFRDATPLLASPNYFKALIQQMAGQWAFEHIQAIAALDARGFIFGTALAMHMELPLILVRKKGKLPGAVMSESYDLEYGSNTLEIGMGMVGNRRVLVVDDLLATGGTAKAACSLIEKSGGTVVGCAFVIELSDLPGREKLAGYSVKSLVTY